MQHANYLYVLSIKIVNKAPIAKRFHSGHVKCQHAIQNEQSLSTVGQK